MVQLVTRMIPLVVVLGALFGAPAAQAALTAEADAATKTVTITGDDAGDSLTLSDSSGLLAHNINSPALETPQDFDTDPGVQSVAADSSWQVVVNSGGGADSVTISTPGVLRVLANVGAGDDLVQGGASADEVDGGAGHDRLAGGRGGDKLLGGDGDDTLVWNNGDGSDDVDGQGGSDTSEVNGAPTLGDAFHVQPAGDGNVRLDRINLGLFNLRITPATERVQINGLGGDDAVTTDPGLAALGVGLTLDGGTGKDSLTGGDGADAISGGEDVDNLNGGGGDDRIAGNRDNDVMAGGDGDDALVWNNGDGTDRADGDAGFDVMEVNGSGAGDAFTVKAEGARTRLDRTNLVPFALDVAAEVLELNMLGGDDTVAASGSPPILLDVDGGGGGDTLTGDTGHDALRGGPGPDSITGGTGSDVIDGGDGDDTIAARDEQADLVRCGAGTDTATLDRAAVDAAADCETANRPAEPPDTPPDAPPNTPPAVAKPAAVRIATRSVTVRRRRAAIRLACPAGATTCQGRLTLTTLRAVRVGRARVVVVLGSASYRIAPGATARVKLQLTRSLRTIAGKARRLRTRAVANSDGEGGAKLVTTRRVTLRRAKRW